MTGGAVTHEVVVGKDKGSWKAPTIVAAVIAVLGAAIALILSALGPADGESTGAASPVAPATVEKVEGSDIARVTLTAQAAERLDLQTAEAATESVAGRQRLVIPYSSIIYDADGGTWTYTNPEPLVYERAAISIDSIDGDRVLLLEGPPAGTPVVVVGAAELFGAEFGVGH